jgi:hypothetical protein
MVNVWIGVKDASNAVSTKVSDRAETSGSDVVFNDASNVLVIIAGLAKVARGNPTIVGGLQQVPRGMVALAGHEHFRTISVVAIQITRDIEIDDIPVLQLAIIRNAVTNNFIDRGAT